MPTCVCISYSCSLRYWFSRVQTSMCPPLKSLSLPLLLIMPWFTSQLTRTGGIQTARWPASGCWDTAVPADYNPPVPDDAGANCHPVELLETVCHYIWQVPTVIRSQLMLVCILTCNNVILSIMFLCVGLSVCVCVSCGCALVYMCELCMNGYIDTVCMLCVYVCLCVDICVHYACLSVCIGIL